MHGIAALTVYDIAHRIGAFLRKAPALVYLHRGSGYPWFQRKDHRSEAATACFLALNGGPNEGILGWDRLG